MPIIVACPKCATKLSAPDHAAGKQVRCPKPGCEAIADVPAFLAAQEVEVIDAVPAPTKPMPKPVRNDDDDDRPRQQSRRRDDDYEFDRRRRRRQAKSGANAGVVIATVLGSLVLLGGLGFGIYALVSGKSGLFAAKKAAPPAGWKQFTYEKDNFKAYFPSEPSVNTMDGFGAGFAGLNVPGSTMPNSFSIYLPRDLFAPTHASVIVVRYTSSLPSSERRKMRDALLHNRDRDFGEVKDTKSVRWLGVDADEVSTPRNLTRVALVGNTLYVAEIGANNGRATSAEEYGFFDNFELIK